jgi:hypothetical protein
MQTIAIMNMSTIRIEQQLTINNMKQENAKCLHDAGAQNQRAQHDKVQVC